MEVVMEINRDIYLERLIDRKHNGFIKVITGIRRCGKSYLLNTLFYNHLKSENIAEDHIIKFAFDTASLTCLSLSDITLLNCFIASTSVISSIYFGL